MPVRFEYVNWHCAVFSSSRRRTNASNCSRGRMARERLGYFPFDVVHLTDWDRAPVGNREPTIDAVIVPIICPGHPFYTLAPFGTDGLAPLKVNGEIGQAEPLGEPGLPTPVLARGTQSTP